MAIMAATNMNNNRNGSGAFTPLRRNGQSKNSQLAANLDILDRKDIRMRFKNSRDPLYVAFDYLDKRPIQELAVEFVKDSIFDIMNFVSMGKI